MNEKVEDKVYQEVIHKIEDEVEAEDIHKDIQGDFF